MPGGDCQRSGGAGEHFASGCALAGSGLVMACQSRVSADLVVRLRQTHEATLQVVGDSHFLVSQEFLPDREHLSPLYRTETFVVPPATIEEHYSDWQRLVRELTRGNGRAPVRTSLAVLRKLAAALREEEGLVTVLLQEDDVGLQVLDIQAGRMPFLAVGLAIDIGTTTLAVQMVSLHDGQVLAMRTSYNAQISRGADIISRIDYARTPERLGELRALVLDTLNEMIASMCAHAGVPLEAIRTVFVAGNTTMIHLLLGLPPRHIREAPYVPTVNAVPALTAGEIGLAVTPQVLVTCAPGVGSYVGGDITAGVLCTEIPSNHDDVFLFLDIGTNGEIVLGNADWMVTCACSAGPAFEGSGIKCGMRATEGAIEYIEISDDAATVTYDVIGGGKARRHLRLRLDLPARGAAAARHHRSVRPFQQRSALGPAGAARHGTRLRAGVGAPIRAKATIWSLPSRISRTCCAPRRPSMPRAR